MDTEQTKQTIHKGWDTLPPLIHPDKANSQPNPTLRQPKNLHFIESYLKSREIQEPKTYIIERIIF